MNQAANQGAAAAAADEARTLLESAVHAMQSGDDERSLALLQRSIAASHFNPKAHYLLGAECAHRQKYGDAVLHMTTAVEQDPALPTARLQLGLLWLTLGNPSAASVPIEPLRSLPDGDAMRHFAEALSGLCRDDLAAASAELRAGLLITSDNAPLMADMQRLLGAVEERLQTAADQARLNTSSIDSPAVSHDMAISAYTGRGKGS